MAFIEVEVPILVAQFVERRAAETTASSGIAKEKST